MSKKRASRASGTLASTVRLQVTFQPGTIVRNKGSGNAYTVIANYGDRAVAVRECSIMNPAEWEVVRVPSEPNDNLTGGS